jgi:hypothetical protein
MPLKWRIGRAKHTYIMVKARLGYSWIYYRHSKLLAWFFVRAALKDVWQGIKWQIWT